MILYTLITVGSLIFILYHIRKALKETGFLPYLKPVVIMLAIILFWIILGLTTVGLIGTHLVKEVKQSKQTSSYTTYTPGYYVFGPNKGQPTGYCDVCGRPDSYYEQ
jgi:hypothetical protein